MFSGFGEFGVPKSKFTGKEDKRCQEIVAARVDHRQGPTNTAANKLFPAMVGLRA
jgi:hypothetical protein